MDAADLITEVLGKWTGHDGVGSWDLDYHSAANAETGYGSLVRSSSPGTGPTREPARKNSMSKVESTLNLVAGYINDGDTSALFTPPLSIRHHSMTGH